MNHTSQIGASMSLLVRGVHSLVTENETGDFLRQRVAEIRADAHAVIRHAEMIAVARGFAGGITLCADCGHEECSCAADLRKKATWLDDGQASSL